MIARRLTFATVACVCAHVGVLLFAGVAARAALIHDYLPGVSAAIGQGAPAGSGAPVTGPVSGVQSMTVDSGHLWMAEHIEGTNNYRTDEFDASTGAFISQLSQTPSSIYFLTDGVAVGHATGTPLVYVGGAESSTREGVVAVSDASSGAFITSWNGAQTPSKGFGEASGNLAVDESQTDPAAGDVYVADPEKDVVDVFEPKANGEEHYIGQLTGISAAEPFTRPARVAVGAGGEVLVLDRTGSGEVIDVFQPEILGGYQFVRKIPAEVGASIAVDDVSGEIYAARGSVVDEFSSTGAYLGRITGENTSAGDIDEANSVAVDPESHDVYVGDYRRAGKPPQASVVDAFGPDLTIPDVTTESASSIGSRSATLNGAVNPDGAGEATCWFDWGTTPELGEQAKCPAPVANGSSPVEVRAVLSGVLQPGTTYYFRLEASNKNGTNLGEPGQDQKFTTSGPGLHGESVSNVTAESATLDATINPHGAPTTYYFQYGKTTAYEDPPVPTPPGASAGSGDGEVEVAEHVQGLSAGTVYHYRVVTVSDVAGVIEEFDGPDETFTTQAAGGASVLPDGRSWEMVTPAQKQGALLLHVDSALGGEGLDDQAATDGQAFADQAVLPTETNPQGYVDSETVFSTRGPTGWSSRDISPPNDRVTGLTNGLGNAYRFFSEDLSQAIVQPFTATPLSSLATEPTAYLHSDYLNGSVDERCENACFTPLVTAANTPPGTMFGENRHTSELGSGPYFLGATPDATHIILASGVSLTSALIPPLENQNDKNEGLYEWSAGGLQLVSVLPEGEAEGGGSVAFRPDLGSHESSTAWHAISDDGSRIIWHSSPKSSGSPIHLYMRETGQGHGKTVRLDLPQGVAETDSGTPEYLTASSDGSKIFFTDNERLTTDASASGSDLYEYEVGAPVGSRLTDLSVAPKPGEVAEVGQAFVSEDGSYVYFEAAGVLALGATRETCPSNSQPCRNLYVRHAGITTFIAKLSSEDPELGIVARVSPNGLWFEFMSDRSLTGYDTRDAVNGHSDEEVYLYDATAGRVVCASCDPTGARPVGTQFPLAEKLVSGDRQFPETTWYAANVAPISRFDLGEMRYQSRYLSDSGRLYFDAYGALVPDDVNGTQDVYEYEPAGVGDCAAGSVTFSERSGGCAGLISSGSSPEESAFVDASASGGDVFFLTAAKLAPQDFDDALDVYDAHECTSAVPCFAPSPVPAPPCSTGDSCKAAPSPQPSVFGSPSSATFTGAGNVSPPASGSVVSSRRLTRAQKLAQALRTCRKKRDRLRRLGCKAKARKRFGASGSRQSSAKQKGGR